MMKPLEQWYCDRCGEVIASPKDGWLEWVKEDKKHSFKIVHHAAASPRHPSGDCYHYTHHPGRQDNHLDIYLGPRGLAHLLSFLDLGRMHDPELRHSPQVQSIREFVEIMRRLTLPYYEEARRYWRRADEAGYFEAANEVWIYLPGTLQTLVEKYGKEEE